MNTFLWGAGVFCGFVIGYTLARLSDLIRDIGE